MHDFMNSYDWLADDERIRSTAYHPQGTFLAISPDQLDSSLLPRFAQMVDAFPDHLALQEGNRTLTYQQLDAAATRLANTLLAAMRPEANGVALLFGMEMEWIVATLAVWKAGKFWVALELRHPEARQSAILEDAQATLILTTKRHHELANSLAGEHRQWLTVEQALADAPADEPVILPAVEIGPESYAYLVYTSGSTGRPKGVIENHTNILHMIHERGELVHPSSADRIALLLPPAAGGAVYNIVLALWYGAALMLFEFVDEGVKRFEEWLLAEAITGMHAGVVLRTWLPTLDGSRQFPALRFLLLGAAPVYREHVTAFQRYLGGTCILVNPYSSAEVRAASLFAMDASTKLSSQIIPVGFPPSWVTFEIWDENGELLPSGATGEVVIFTHYMTPGYWRQPDLTANVFGVDGAGRRYYRCGDVGRLDADGCLWILGRKDRQIKIRGHRVEPAEVEVELLNVTGVREAAVVVQGTRDDENHLAAYITLEPGSRLSVAELRHEIATRLPNYMLPRQVTVMEKLPRNGYGKVDRPHLRSMIAPHQQSFDRGTEKSDMALNLSTDVVMQHEADRAEQGKVGEHYYHPKGEFIPITPAESELTLLHRWGRMVEQFGLNPALEETHRTLTYHELNALANRIAHAILARKLPNDVPLAILFEVEGDVPISMLAIWKAAKFFVWFEPKQPLARNQMMAEDSGASLVITNRTHAHLARQLWPTDAVIVIEEVADDLPVYDPPVAVEASTPACLTYTSGSTGKPKGIVEIHRNLLMMMVVRQPLLHFSSQDRVTFLTQGSGCIYTISSALMYGGCVLPFQVRDEGWMRFSQWLIERHLTHAISGPVLRAWLLTLDGSLQFPDLRILSIGAGPMYREHFQAYQRYLSDRCVVSNFYSSTELRSGTLYLLDKECQITTRLIPAGYPTLHANVEIWDDKDKPVPPGETGEIVIFTPYAALGYWKSPELTASRFGVDAQGRRYYRMGDLGRLDQEGCLWVLGRKDDQFKIRGNRVETAEVEVALLELANVHEAAVIHLGETDEERMLVAFAACRLPTSGNELRKQLAAHLPAYMVPSTLIVLEELPRNANGKVARPLLREMAMAFAHASRESIQATESVFRTETETRVAGLMHELLMGGAVGPNDNFFEIGGHSLLSARLMLQIHRTFGVDLSPRDFIVNPTVAALSQRIDQALSNQRGLAFAAQQARTLRIEAMQVMSGTPEHLPIFFCLGGNASPIVLLRYQKLIRRLGKQWPLYAFVTMENDDSNGLYRTMDELVSETLTALRRVQPHGPYLLLGECHGGKLAYAVAHALAQEGEPIALLALLDATWQRNDSNNFALATWRERFEQYQQQMAGLGWQGGARYLFDRLAAQLPHSIYPYPTEYRGHLAQKRYFDLLTNFRPSQIYAQPTLAIYTRQNQPHLAAWAALMPRLEVTMVEGTHQSYVQLSSDQVIATVGKALDAAQQKASMPVRG